MKRVALLAASVLGVAVLAGCTAPTGATPATSTGPSAVRGIGGLASGSATGNPAGPAPTTVAGSSEVQACPAAAMSLGQLPDQTGAAGTIAVAIQLTNTSSRRCTVRGYPDFTLTVPSASMGRDVEVPVTLEHGTAFPGLAFSDPPSTVDITPGGHAGFLIAYSDVPTGGAAGCDQATKLHLLADDGNRVVGPAQVRICQPGLLVSPFVAADRLKV